MNDHLVEDSASAIETDLELCQEKIGYQFRSLQLLIDALKHASGVSHRLASNERLEFLGDAISRGRRLRATLPAVPRVPRGRSDANQVDRRQPSDLRPQISEMGMQEYLILGKGMATHPGVPPSVVARRLESLIAAIYLDGGGSGQRFILRQSPTKSN